MRVRTDQTAALAAYLAPQTSTSLNGSPGLGDLPLNGIVGGTTDIAIFRQRVTDPGYSADGGDGDGAERSHDLRGPRPIGRRHFARPFDTRTARWIPAAGAGTAHSATPTGATAAAPAATSAPDGSPAACGTTAGEHSSATQQPGASAIAARSALRRLRHRFQNHQRLIRARNYRLGDSDQLSLLVEHTEPRRVSNRRNQVAQARFARSWPVPAESARE